MGIKTETTYKKGKEGRTVIEDFHDEYGIIPKGFWFDGASAPAILYPWVSPFENEAISGRHDLDCQEARSCMAEAEYFAKQEMFLIAEELEKKALEVRAEANRRYMKGMIQAKRKAYKLSWRGNVVGSLAWAGVRVGSFFGVGW